MRYFAALLFALSFASSSLGKVYFQETFDKDWESRWVQSKSRSDYGKFKLSHGKFYGDATKDLGIQTSQDARFYAISTKFDSFSNKDKDLVLQFSVKHEQKLDCGGGYIKLLPKGLDQENFNGDSTYNIMFGPDICGSSKKVHVILNYKGENYLIEKTIQPATDEDTHVYTLVIHPDQTYEVLIDQKSVQTGKIEDDWKMLGPKKIKDPNAKKPEDWDERPKIPDPQDSKPADWDDEPEFIDDPEASKPEDWDDDMDGEWIAPKIPNPEFKGEWHPKQIDNPNYQGIWVHPEIDNPDYEHDASIYSFPSHAFVGFDLWQVKSGTIFDNVIVTDSLSEAKKFYDETTGSTIEGEKKAKAAADEAARKEAEEEAKKRAAEAKEEEEEEEDEFEDEEEEKEEERERDEL